MPKPRRVGRRVHFGRTPVPPALSSSPPMLSSGSGMVWRDVSSDEREPPRVGQKRQRNSATEKCIEAPQRLHR